MDRLVELIRLHRLGVSDNKAATLLKMGPNTLSNAKKVFQQANLWDGDAEHLPEPARLHALLPQRKPPQQTSNAEPWIEILKPLLSSGASIAALHSRLSLQYPDFTVSYNSIKRIIRRLQQQNSPISPADVAIPILTPPGQQAQVDFAYIGMVRDPADQQLKKAWVFVMVLAFSRHFFAEIVFNQQVPTWLALHQRAFSFFGGTPQVIVPDNLKAAVISTSFGLDPDREIQRSYRELARHYGFIIDPTPPYAPQKKGKVERLMAYVEDFLSTRNPNTPLDELNRELEHWNRTIAAQRIHATTQQPPILRFQQEKESLLPLPAQPYQLTSWHLATVQRDAHVHFAQHFFSVPWTQMRQEVWVRLLPEKIEIYAEDVLIAEHAYPGKDRYSTLAAHLPPRAALAQRNPAWWLKKAEEFGPFTLQWTRERFAAQKGESQLGRVQAVLLLLEGLEPGRGEKVCQRALAYGLTRKSEFTNVIERGLDRQNTPASTPPEEAPTKFCRSLKELARCHAEVDHA